MGVDLKAKNRAIEKSPSGGKRTPGRSIPLELNATEDHDATPMRGGYERIGSAYARITQSVKCRIR